MIKINLDVLSKSLSRGNTHLDLAIKNVEEIGNELGGLVKRLYPQAIEKYSLKKNLESLVRNFSEAKDLKIISDFDEYPEELSKELKLDVFRIFQEALNNIVKHSDASEVNLSLKTGDRQLNLLISDNGKGFDYSGLQNRMGAGLFTMQERVDKYEGIFEIDSKPGNGTRINIRIKT